MNKKKLLWAWLVSLNLVCLSIFAGKMVSDYSNAFPAIIVGSLAVWLIIWLFLLVLERWG